MTSSSRTFRQRLWRWHFFAGLLVCPFAILLAVTGSIYLFKPQIEQLQETRINALASVDSSTFTALPYQQMLTGLLFDNPGSRFKQLTLNKPGDRTVEIELLDTARQPVTYWVDIYSGQVLDSKASNKRFLALVKKLHSELLLGRAGSYVVELMACWLIILLISGLYLWLSRPHTTGSISRIRASFTPRIKPASPLTRWRSWHGVLGLWFAVPILVLLLSGLPWTQLWGSGFAQLKQLAGWQGPGQEWFVTLKSGTPEATVAKEDIQQVFDDSLWQINSDQTDQAAPFNTVAQWSISLDQIIGKEDVQSLTHPIRVISPKPDNGVWTVRSMPAERSRRTTLHYDQHSGEELMRIDFEDHHPVQRFVSHSISLHEGALFGWPNQLLGLLTALAVIAVSSFGCYLWWLRKPAGLLGAPGRSSEPMPAKLLIIIVLMALLLPAAGISILVIALFEQVGYRKFVKNRPDQGFFHESEQK